MKRKRRRMHRPSSLGWSRSLPLIRAEIRDELATIKRRRLEVAAFTATFNLLNVQAADARRSIRKAESRLRRLRRDLRRGEK